MGILLDENTITRVTRARDQDEREWMGRSCVGKRCYLTCRAAKDEAKYYKSKGGRRFYPYTCTVCGGWHLTRKSKRRQRK